MSEVKDNLRRVRDQIDQAAVRAGRSPDAVRLIAVSKGFGIESIKQAVGVGQMDFGENRAAELLAKAGGLPPDLVWHFVGRLQSNKVAKVLEAAPIIHSVDRLRIAEQLNRRATGKCRVLVEVNVSGEAAKGGVTPGEASALVGSVLLMPHLELLGLMTMAPFGTDGEESRGHFRALASLKENLEREIPGLTIHHLSMGMSQDYVVAVEEGATMVRIGEAIFGTRRNGRSERR